MWSRAWVLTVLASAVAAAGPRSSYEVLNEKAVAQESKRETLGWSLVLSGAAAFGASVPAYHLSQDLSAKAVYTLGQAIGIAAIGAGLHTLWIGPDYARFARTLRADGTLTAGQRDRLAETYLAEAAKAARASRWVRSSTLGALAVVEGVNFALTSQPELRLAHGFLGGAALAAGLGMLIFPSEEERDLRSVTSYKDTQKLRFTGIHWGNGVELAFRF